MGVTLQINVAPSDLPHAGPVLRHQLGVWAAQVDEVVFSFDVTPPAGGRFGAGWSERLAPMERLLEELCAAHPAARIAPVAGKDVFVFDVETPKFMVATRWMYCQYADQMD